MDTLYTLTPTYFLFRDRAEDERLERLKFHIDQGDYFPFLATVIGFLKETCESYAHISGSDAHAQAVFAEDIRKDLIYLHEHYDLIEKEEPILYTREKMVRF